MTRAKPKTRISAVEMKESSVQWLGEIPEHWELSSLRHAVTIHDERRIPLNGEQRADIPGEYPYCGANGVVDYIDDYIFDGEYVLLAEDGGYWGQHERSAYRVSGKFWVNNHAHILQSIPCKSDNDFVCYILIHADIDSCITGSTRGKLNQSAMKSIPLPLPPLHEQRAIASYLDRETAKIDRFINKTEALNALLREKRVALISRAVTKGLDAGVEIVGSGVEWLGEIPRHWDVRNFKYIARLEYGDSLKAEDRVDDEVPVFGSNGVVGYHDVSNTLAPTIVVGRKGSFGKVNYSNIPVFAIDTTYFVDKRTTSQDIRWVYYFLQILELDKSSKDSAVPGLGREEVYSLRSALPPLHEQRAIADHLDRETAKIDALINKNDELIALLREKRTALISAAVTGKIEMDLTPPPAPPQGIGEGSSGAL